MANTKHSAAREIIIDRLLRNRRGYCISEILEKVNNALELEGFRPVSINTIRNDMHNFQYLFRMRLIVEKKGCREYFRYEDPECSVFKNLLTMGEMQQLHAALQSLRFLDAVQGTLMYKEMTNRLCGLLKLETADRPVVIYEKQPKANDLKRFQVLYDYILEMRPAVISYCKADRTMVRDSTIHPYFLLLRNEKWILLCHDESVDAGVEIPISRISRICEAEDVEFIPNNDFDVKDYYKEMDSAA